MRTSEKLPYNLKITGNEVLVELKNPSATFNLNRLTQDEATTLGYQLMNWGCPEHTVIEPENAELEPIESENDFA